MGRKKKEAQGAMTQDPVSLQPTVGNMEAATPVRSKRTRTKAKDVVKDTSNERMTIGTELPPPPVAAAGESGKRNKSKKKVAAGPQYDEALAHMPAPVAVPRTKKGKGTKRQPPEEASSDAPETDPDFTIPTPKKRRTHVRRVERLPVAQQHVDSISDEARSCGCGDEQVLSDTQPAAGDDTTPPVTPAAKVTKPKRKSKATIGQEAVVALASQGDLEPQFLLYREYPHARAFSLVGMQTTAQVGAHETQGTAGEPYTSQPFTAVTASQANRLVPAPSLGAASQLDALQATQTSMVYLASQPVEGGTHDTLTGYVPHRFTQTHMSTVLTYHADDFRRAQQPSATALAFQEAAVTGIQITDASPYTAVDSTTNAPPLAGRTAIGQAAADADALACAGAGAGNSHVQPNFGIKDGSDSDNRAQPDKSVLDDKRAPGADVAAVLSSQHGVEHDTEELPQDIKSIVLEAGLAGRIKSRSRRATRSKPLESKDQGMPSMSDGNRKEVGVEAARKRSPAPSKHLPVGDDQLDLKLVENLQPIGTNMTIIEVPPDDPDFNKQLRGNPWPSVVPNLGYACLCATLRAYDVHCSRDCIQKTFLEKGLPVISQLALANARDLLALIRWNARHGIQLFRLSSGILPWMSKYKVEELPDYEAIKEALAAAGAAARSCGQRLTFHPSEFVKIAGPEDRDHWTDQSICELEQHSKIFDLMGYEPSPWNKLNIHVGATYSDKEATLKRFAKVVNERLSPNCKARLCVENDDKASMYSVKDLLVLHEMCGVPITFDFHHHKFCTGGWTEVQAFEAAVSTWPRGIRPVVHWSEAANDSRAQAHSDYVYGPIYLHGYEADVDVMIESKAKEVALLRYRELHIRKVTELGTAGMPSAGAASRVASPPSSNVEM